MTLDDLAQLQAGPLSPCLLCHTRAHPTTHEGPSLLLQDSPHRRHFPRQVKVAAWVPWPFWKFLANVVLLSSYREESLAFNSGGQMK